MKEQARGVAEDLRKIQPAMQNPLFAKMVAMESDRKEGADGIKTNCA
jgi:hypothetical protein